jgi:hypothetical protein
MAGNDRVAMMPTFPERPFRNVKPEIRLSHLWIWAMTTETATRQDGLHVLIEVQPARSSAMTSDESAQNIDSQN